MVASCEATVLLNPSFSTACFASILIICSIVEVWSPTTF